MRNGGASLVQWAVDSRQWSVTVGQGTAHTLRESEIRSQEELADLIPSWERSEYASAEDIALAELLRSLLEELELCEWTGILPGGLPWTHQVWWRVELWRTFWQERDLRLLRASEGP